MVFLSQGDEQREGCTAAEEDEHDVRHLRRPMNQRDAASEGDGAQHRDPAG